MVRRALAMLGYGANRALFGMYGSFGGERLPNGTQITRLFSAMSDLERSATDPAVTADPEHIHFAVAPEIASTGSRYRRSPHFATSGSAKPGENCCGDRSGGEVQ